MDVGRKTNKQVRNQNTNVCLCCLFELLSWIRTATRRLVKLQRAHGGYLGASSRRRTHDTAIFREEPVKAKIRGFPNGATPPS